MLILLPEADTGPAERVVRMRVAVAVTSLGGWAVLGWRGAASSALQEGVKLLADDPVGAIRFITLDVPVLADAALAELLGDDACPLSP